MLWGFGEAIMNLPLCEGCIFGKGQVKSFPFESN
jgi:hypothetical protein